MDALAEDPRRRALVTLALGARCQGDQRSRSTARPRVVGLEVGAGDRVGIAAGVGAPVHQPRRGRHPTTELARRFVDQPHRFVADQVAGGAGRQGIRWRVELAVPVALEFPGIDVIGREAAIARDRIGVRHRLESRSRRRQNRQYRQDRRPDSGAHAGPRIGQSNHERLLRRVRPRHDERTGRTRRSPTHQAPAGSCRNRPVPARGVW